MASQPSKSPFESRANPPLVPVPVNPLHFVPPTARELRGQSVQRLQVGLFGLASMLLLVGLANIIMDRAMISDDATAASAAASATAARVSPGAATAPAANDPLADIGVVPDMPAAQSTAPGASTAARPPG